MFNSIFFAILPIFDVDLKLNATKAMIQFKKAYEKKKKVT